MNETPIDMVLYCPKCGMQHIDAPDPGVPAVGIRRTENGDVPFDYLAEPTWGNPPHKSHLCHGCGHIWRPSDHPTNGVARTASGKHADTVPADLATLRAEIATPKGPRPCACDWCSCGNATDMASCWAWDERVVVANDLRAEAKEPRP